MNIVVSFRSRTKVLVVLSILSLCCMFACAPEKGAQVNLIPEPVSMKSGIGYYKLDSAKVMTEGLDSFINGKIEFSLKDIGEEGYILSVTPEKV